MRSRTFRRLRRRLGTLRCALRCGQQLLPGLTSASVERAAAENPQWEVASCAGQGVFAIEECLERLLRRVREDTAAAGTEGSADAAERD